MESVSPYRIRPARPAPPRRTNAYQAAAWRAPGARPFDHRPANDMAANDAGEGIPPRLHLAPSPPPPEPAVDKGEPVRPGWVVAVAGAVLAILLGLAAGGSLAL